MKSLSISAFLFVVLLLQAYAVCQEYYYGGWEPMTDIQDTRAQGAGIFAVSEYNKLSKGSLKFVAVMKGESQVVAGITYKLDVEAEEGGVTKNYEAIVHLRAGDVIVSEKLISFEPITG